MKKRFAVIILAALMLFSAVACTGGGKPNGGPDQPGNEDSKEKFVYIYEANELYAQGLDGSGLERLAEGAVRIADQYNEYVSYATGDGAYMMNIITGETKKITDETVVNLKTVGSRALYGEYTKLPGNAELKAYDFDTEETVTVCEGWNFAYLAAEGNDLAYYDYEWDGSSGTDYVVYFDLEKNEEVWRQELQPFSGLYIHEGKLYLNVQQPGGRIVWQVMDLETQETEPLELDLKNYDRVLFIGSGGIWGCNDSYEIFFVSESGRETVGKYNEAYVRLVSVYGDKALVAMTEYREAEELEYWYSADRFLVLDGSRPVIEEMTELGEYGKMFKDGDFPVMDSSTARKPVTSQIYSFFCLSKGIEGAQPLCSTTHGAWLNIADRKADIALLAAPTDEEKAYLEEKGVEVEMKLYGGDGLVFISNKECGVTDLTIDQIKAIYRGEITNWKELGGVDHEITVMYRDDQSGSQRLFESLVWGDEQVPDFRSLGFVLFGEMSSIVSYCIEDPYAVGYSIMTYLSVTFSYDELQAFSINGVEPTPENVASRDYVLGTRGYVVIRSDEEEDSPARRLYNWFGTEACDDILLGNSVTPLSE